MANTNEKSKQKEFDEGIISSIVVNGDISRLSPEQKVAYYQQMCERCGLDALSQPFKLLRLNGKEIMYCDRSGAAQLNKVHKVSHEIRARETVNGCYVVTAQASTPDGRHTESIGAVNIDNLRGDNLCNALMKAETKAKRRSTLDLLGLGFLDESEVETIKGAEPASLEHVKNEDGSHAIRASAGEAAPSSQPAAGGNHQSQFKRKYESVDELRKVMGNAKDIKDIANLYYINADIVESQPELKQEFSEKKNELLGSSKNSISA